MSTGTDTLLGEIEVSACSAWIAPDGKATWVGHGSHSLTARRLLPNSDDAGYELEKQGYVHMSYGYCDMGLRKHPTQAQLNTLGDIIVCLQAEKPHSPHIDKLQRYVAAQEAP